MHLSREPRAPVATGALYLCGVQSQADYLYVRQLRDMYLSVMRGRFKLSTSRPESFWTGNAEVARLRALLPQ
jgi:hypothetical protein